MEEKGLDLSKYRGQGYDGIATMSGVYSGVQSCILKKGPNALCVHCVAHNLNLVLNDTVSQVQEVSQLFDVLLWQHQTMGYSVIVYNCVEYQTPGIAPNKMVFL